MQSNTPSWFSRWYSLKKIGWVFKWVLLGAMLSYLYLTIQEKGQSLQDIYQLLRERFTVNHLTELGLVIVLTPLNWACESRKWQLLAQKIEKISFFQSLKGVLSGLALGFIMPNNVGDAAGRVLSLQSAKRLTGVGAALLSNGLQFYVSLFFGTVGWGFFILEQLSLQNWPQLTLLGILTATLLFGIWLIISRKKAEVYLERFRWFRWIEPYVDVIAQYELVEIWQAFRWALLRYGVFSLQFGLLLSIFEVSLPILAALACIFLVFFAKTLIPALNFLGDLGIREASSLYFFSFYNIAPARIVAVTLTLWCINILLPVLVGVFWTMKMKWWRE
ncbi:hypothetical protein Runsl_4134 [Runella slithyformis DSM 19594]|uniref:Uncharacterized protein n=2 Tax=Runella TaxID=105 RepID=A0A7U3ZNJ0_RUNSL|nr:hypothetical protein Runsl_4134 [Runella slithyformis DSM 19594]